MIPSPRRSTAATMTAVIITTSFLKGVACGPPGACCQPWLLLPPGGRSAPPTPGGFMRGRWPLPPLICRRSALHPGDFPDAGKVTKGAPRTAALWNPASTKKRPFWCCANSCTRAAFYHKNRPICHFEQVGKSVLFFPLVSSREHSVFSIRGAADSLPPRMLEDLSSRNQYR